MTTSPDQSTPSIATHIGVLTLAVMNVASVVSLGGLPSEAKYGLAAVFYYVFAAIFFLVPLGLVAAELATGWPERGGVFRWVSEAFGARWGFLAIFILWIQTTIWFPSCLIYGGSALAFAGPALNWDEALAANKYYIAAIVLLLYWSATACALRGVGLVSIIARWSGLIGTIAPAALLIVFGVVYYHSGRPMYVDIDWKDLVPDFSNFDNLVLAAGVFLCYAGLEMNAIHVEDIRNARRAYPLAILISALVIVAIYTLGTLTTHDLPTIAGVLTGNDGSDHHRDHGSGLRIPQRGLRCSGRPAEESAEEEEAPAQESRSHPAKELLTGSRFLG